MSAFRLLSAYLNLRAGILYFHSGRFSLELMRGWRPCWRFRVADRDVPDWLDALLWHIDRELGRVMQNRNQEEYNSPFGGGDWFNNGVFEVDPYCWGDEEQQHYNFKWRSLEIRWYKYCGRGMTMNRHISPQEGADMLDECLKSIRREDIDYRSEVQKGRWDGQDAPRRSRTRRPPEEVERIREFNDETSRMVMEAFGDKLIVHHITPEDLEKAREEAERCPPPAIS